MMVSDIFCMCDCSVFVFCGWNFDEFWESKYADLGLMETYHWTLPAKVFERSNNAEA